MATLKPTTPLLTPNKGTLKPASPLRPKTAPKTPISRPQRRWRFQSHTGSSEQRRRWFQTTGPPIRQSQAAVPVGGGGAWPGFETTRRAKLAARTARGRAAAHRHTQRPGPPAPATPVGPQATPQPHPQRHEAATGFPATASSRSHSGAQRSATSDQAVMSTWSSTAARPASRRATGTRNGEQDT